MSGWTWGYFVHTEFRFSDQDFAEVCTLIYQRAGINLNDSKKPMVYSRLARRLRDLGLRSFSDYLALLAATPESPEWAQFTNALTTNLTAFFREPHHFDILSELAPQWLKTHRKLSVWCCASSTGEEPYSIMMTLLNSLGEIRPAVSLLASDLDTQVLEKARTGVYAAERLASLNDEYRRHFFLRGKGSFSGMVKVRRELRELIEFRQINLLAPDWRLSGPFDAIFCRNVMIYFDKPTQRELLKRFLPLLRPDGRLFVGHSESLSHVNDLWVSCGQTVYRPRGNYAYD